MGLIGAIRKKQQHNKIDGNPPHRYILTTGLSLDLEWTLPLYVKEEKKYKREKGAKAQTGLVYFLSDEPSSVRVFFLSSSGNDALRSFLISLNIS